MFLINPDSMNIGVKKLDFFFFWAFRVYIQQLLLFSDIIQTFSPSSASALISLERGGLAPGLAFHSIPGLAILLGNFIYMMAHLAQFLYLLIIHATSYFEFCLLELLHLLN